MQGNAKVLKCLSDSLKAELTAINQYFLHAKMCENWGYLWLGAYYRKESIEEMVHAEKLMNRILFLDRTPNMIDIGPIKVGKNVQGAARKRPRAGAACGRLASPLGLI